jgi:hypothetical protein
MQLPKVQDFLQITKQQQDEAVRHNQCNVCQAGGRQTLWRFSVIFAEQDREKSLAKTKKD